MARMATIATRVEQLLGRSVVATAAVPGGSICTATRVRLADGSSVLVKSRPQPPAGFFAAEAAGLGWLAEATATGGVPVPAVEAVTDDCLVLGWIEPGKPTVEAAERFGRELATTHAAGAPSFGHPGGGATWIGTAPLPQDPAESWPEFYATRRVQPYLRVALDNNRLEPADGAAVEQVLGRLPDLAGPAEQPARLHGDLWSGNVVWGASEHGHAVDPAAHGGHRETDLAMLALFGVPRLDRVLASYHETSPLADGWRDRVPLHQLHPLLVHAALFGGSYGAHAGLAARTLLEPARR